MRTILRRTLACCALLVSLVSAGALAYNIDTSPQTFNNVNGLWWNSSESGWGVTFTQQGSIIFATIFTYDAFGSPYWYVASNCAISGGSCAGDLYRVTGGSPITSPWTPNLSLVKVGTLSVTFSDVNNASMTLNVNGVLRTRSVTRQMFGQVATPPVNTNLANTQLLLGGTWSMSYTIFSPVTDTFTFTSLVRSTPDADGNYYVGGTDQTGQLAVGGYYSAGGIWAILNQAMDKFYTFTFNDNNHVNGCFYQVNPPGSTNFSNCYTLSGVRTPFKSAPRPAAGVDSSPPLFIDPAVLDSYNELRRRLQ